MMRLVLAALLMAAGSAAWAQKEGPEKGPDKPEIMSEKFIERIGERLKLSEAQLAKAKKAAAQARPLIEKKQAEMKAAMKDFQGAVWMAKEKIRETLTDEQKQQFDEMMASMMPQGRRLGGAGRRAEGGGMPGVQPGEERPSSPPDQEQRPQAPMRERDFQDGD